MPIRRNAVTTELPRGAATEILAKSESWRIFLYFSIFSSRE